MSGQQQIKVVKQAARRPTPQDIDTRTPSGRKLPY